jgi:hypothetical protein
MILTLPALASIQVENKRIHYPHRMTKFLLSILLLATSLATTAQDKSKFRQLQQDLPTPNVYRTASGAPGHQYYQQKADYVMDIELDDDKQRIYGASTITYTNNSPDALNYLWLQLDQNMSAKNSDTQKTSTSKMDDKMSPGDLARIAYDFDGGFKIDYVRDAADKDLKFTVNNTMMRVDLPTMLKPGGKVSIKVKWWYNINDRMKIGGRSGYEYFPEDKNYLYTIAQFFPRLCVYNEVNGWQHKQFLRQRRVCSSFWRLYREPHPACRPRCGCHRRMSKPEFGAHLHPTFALQ